MDCNIDFTKCFLCQSDNKNDLRDPSKCPQSYVYNPYQTLALNIIELKNLNQLPFDIDVESFKLFEGGLEKVLEDNKAIWHKKCRNKVDSQKVSRSKKKCSAECSVASPVKTRKLSLSFEGQNVKLVTEGGDNSTKPSCFLCGEYGATGFESGFYRVASFDVDRNVRECAHITGDEALLRRITNRDLIALGAHYHPLCLVRLYDKANRSKKEEPVETEEYSALKAQALSQLIYYVDFKKCFLCQSDDKNDLRDPSKCLKSNEYHPYQTLALNIIELKNLNQLPFDIDVESFKLFEGGLEKVLEDNKAIWHKKCRNKVDSQKVSRSKKKCSAECSVASPVKTRKLSLSFEGQNVKLVTEGGDNSTKPSCFLCGEYGATGFESGFYRVASFDVDRNVRECAHITGDEALLRRITNRDLIALGAHYHRLCLVRLYDKANRMKKEEPVETEENSVLKAQALSELIDYVETYRGTNTVLDMSELSQLYSAYLKSFGLDVYVHVTRLRQSILSAIPDLNEIKNETNRCYELAFDCDISKAMIEISKSDGYSEEVFLLAKAAKIIRRHIFTTKCNFNGTLPQHCQTKAVPIILTTFMQMLLDGPGINKSQSSQRLHLQLNRYHS